eukprot:135084-Pyramimonas_sp.AAC.1
MSLPRVAPGVEMRTNKNGYSGRAPHGCRDLALSKECLTTQLAHRFPRLKKALTMKLLFLNQYYVSLTELDEVGCSRPAIAVDGEHLQPLGGSSRPQ